MARTVARIKAAGGATRTRARDRRRSAGRRARAIASKLRLRGQQQRDQAQAAVRRITGELAGTAPRAEALAEASARCAAQRQTGAAQRCDARRRNGAAAGQARSTTSTRLIERDRAGGGPDPQPAGRGDARVGHPAGQPARPRRPPDPQGPARQAGGVRLQGPGRRQRRRDRPRPHRREAATRPTHRNWPRRSSGSPTAPGAHHARSPLTAATARHGRTRPA